MTSVGDSLLENIAPRSSQQTTSVDSSEERLIRDGLSVPVLNGSSILSESVSGTGKYHDQGIASSGTKDTTGNFSNDNSSSKIENKKKSNPPIVKKSDSAHNINLWQDKTYESESSKGSPVSTVEKLPNKQTPLHPHKATNHSVNSSATTHNSLSNNGSNHAHKQNRKQRLSQSPAKVPSTNTDKSFESRSVHQTDICGNQSLENENSKASIERKRPPPESKLSGLGAINTPTDNNIISTGMANGDTDKTTHSSGGTLSTVFSHSDVYPSPVIGKKIKVAKTMTPPVQYSMRDVAVETTSIGVCTSQDDRLAPAPCQPGTDVHLDGVVWQETGNGVLVVSVTWRGKTYVGTLVDASKPEWAPSPRSNNGGTGRFCHNSAAGSLASVSSSAAGEGSPLPVGSVQSNDRLSGAVSNVRPAAARSNSGRSCKRRAPLTATTSIKPTDASPSASNRTQTCVSDTSSVSSSSFSRIPSPPLLKMAVSLSRRSSDDLSHSLSPVIVNRGSDSPSPLLMTIRTKSALVTNSDSYNENGLNTTIVRKTNGEICTDSSTERLDESDVTAERMVVGELNDSSSIESSLSTTLIK